MPTSTPRRAGATASPPSRPASAVAWAAAATASCVAFAAAAGVDWVWELTVLPVAFLLLLGALAASQRPSSEGAAPQGTASIPLRAGLALLGLVAIVVIALPMVSASSIRDSQAEADRVWRSKMEHNRTPMSDVEDDVTFWNGTPEQLAERLAPYVALGFETIISEHPAPYDIESIERLIGQVKPLVDRG